MVAFAVSTKSEAAPVIFPLAAIVPLVAVIASAVTDRTMSPVNVAF